MRYGDPVRTLVQTQPSAIRSRALTRFAVAAGIAVVVGLPAPAGAQSSIDPQGAALSASASCSQGDIEITYTASGVERQITDFTSADGRTLHHYDVRVYSSNHRDVEYILSQTDAPPAPGTLVAVHVTIGSSPPDASTGEFLVAYTCDATSNDEGGHNVVILTCAAMYGTCPKNAAEVAAQLSGTATTAPVAQPVTARPAFTA